MALPALAKQTLLEYLEKKHSGRNQVAVIRKFTTRKKRTWETKKGLSLDLEFIPRQDFEKQKQKGDFYSYEYGEELYGFRRSDVDKALQTHHHIFIIVRDRAMIQQLQMDYPEVCITPVFIYTDREQAERRLSTDGYSSEEVKFRLHPQHCRI